MIFATSFDFTRPADQVGHSVAALPNVAFVSTVFSAGIVACFDEFLDSGVVGMAIVRGENNNRIFCNAGVVYGFDDLAGRPIRFHHEIGNGVNPAFPFEFFGWDHGLVWRGHGEEKEERLFISRLIAHIFDGSFGDLGQDTVEFPFGGDGAAFESAWHYHAYARIVDVTLRRLFDYAVVFDKRERREIRHVSAKVVVEAASNRPVRNRFSEVPTLIFEPVALLDHLTRLRSCPVPAQMPLPHKGRMVALVLKKPWQSNPVFWDEWRLVASDHPFLQASSPSIASGKQAVSRRRAAGCIAMGIGESLGLCAKPIQIRRRNLVFRVVSLNITDSEVVGQNENDIRLVGGLSGEQSDQDAR